MAAAAAAAAAAEMEARILELSSETATAYQAIKQVRLAAVASQRMVLTVPVVAKCTNLQHSQHGDCGLVRHIAASQPAMARVPLSCAATRPSSSASAPRQPSRTTTSRPLLRRRGQKRSAPELACGACGGSCIACVMAQHAGMRAYHAPQHAAHTLHGRSLQRRSTVHRCACRAPAAHCWLPAG